VLALYVLGCCRNGAVQHGSLTGGVPAYMNYLFQADEYTMALISTQFFENEYMVINLAFLPTDLPKSYTLEQ